MRKFAVAIVAFVLGVPAISLGQNLQPMSFQSNGVLIHGWYWLRDPELTHEAWWTFEGIPAGTEDLELEITCLATAGMGGPRGISATFRLAYGFPGAGMMRGVFLTEIVTLPNVSTLDDLVGYTCRGIVKIPRDTPGLAAGRLTVKAERVDPAGPHMAFNKESVALRIGRGVAGAAKLRTAGPAAFASNGVLIEGSHWCRSPGQCLEWQWSPIHDVGRVQEAAINLSLVVTNKTNGGSGYSARVIVQVLALDGTNIFSSFVDLKNPFLP